MNDAAVPIVPQITEDNRTKTTADGRFIAHLFRAAPSLQAGSRWLSDVRGWFGGARCRNADLYSALQARYNDLKLDLAEWRRFLALG